MDRDAIHAFVSHSSGDRALAGTVCETLERRGAKCWIAFRDVTPGELYAAEIMRAINAASAVVVILTERAIKSAHVCREVERSAAKGRKILVLRMDDAQLSLALEYFLSECQWLDARTDGIEHALAVLADMICKQYVFGKAHDFLEDFEGPTYEEQGAGEAAILSALWEHMDANLQKALSIAYARKRRDGSRRISTKDFFQALGCTDDEPTTRLLAMIPAGALPEADHGETDSMRPELQSRELDKLGPITSNSLAVSPAQNPIVAMGPSVRLILSVLRCPERVIPETRHFDSGEVVIGRGPVADWLLNDTAAKPFISRRHCILAFRSGGWTLIDTSMNGTTLNGSRVPGGLPTPALRDGDRLGIGPYEIEVSLAVGQHSTFGVGAVPGQGSTSPQICDSPFANVAIDHFAGPSIILPEDFGADLLAPTPSAAPARPPPAPSVPPTPEERDVFKNSLIDDAPLLSDCVAAALRRFGNLAALPRKLSPADLFVDIAKYGHGSSVERLRKSGVGAGQIDVAVHSLKLEIIRPE